MTVETCYHLYKDRNIHILYLFLFFLISCSNQANESGKAPKADTVVKPVLQSDPGLAGTFSRQSTIHFDSTLLMQFMSKYPDCKVFESRMRRFYRHRNYAYGWYDTSGLIEQAENLYNRINNIKDEGWNGKLLYPAVFQSMMDKDSTVFSTNKPNPEIELMLTAQYFFFAENIWKGMGAEGMQMADWDLPRKRVSYGKLLDSLLSMPSASMTGSEPVFRQYGLLKSYLKKYRDLSDNPDWKTVKTDRKKYLVGDSSPVISIIRKDLSLLGDLPTDNGSEVFDRDLEMAVKNFQQRSGLTDDGVIGPGFINEINEPLTSRIQQLIVNMERCRWVPVKINSDFLVVNIPEYRLHAYEHDSLVWNMDVVVGTNMNKTAIFSGMMNTVVFSPYWNVPPGIMKKEVLPALRKDKSYLVRNHMEWNGSGIRQKPGPWNSLGQVKFLFPNSHNIYLHDTPSKSLFEKEKRAFSHGCIRVAEAKKLAMYVLRKQPEWTESKITAAMEAGKEQFVKINEPIPVFIAYFTAWVDSKGRLNLRHDLYHNDESLAKMMME